MFPVGFLRAKKFCVQKLAKSTQYRILRDRNAAVEKKEYLSPGARTAETQADRRGMSRGAA